MNRKPPPEYKPNSEYIGKESDDVPPMGFFEDFLEYASNVLIPFGLGLLMGGLLLLCFLAGFWGWL